MISFLFYLITMFRLKYFNRKRGTRYDISDPNADIDQPEKTSVLPSDEAWLLSTPSMTKGENLMMTTSNTFDKSAIKLLVKWRPDEK